MQITEVASVSSGRIFRSGLAHLLIGVAWSIGPVLGFLERSGADQGDMQPAVVVIVVLLWPFGVPLLLRGIGLLQQSFGASGYFRATSDGIELRVGGPSLYARVMGAIPQIRILPANPDTFAKRFPEAAPTPDGHHYVYRFRWNQIAAFDISMFAFVIELHSGARLLLRRFYFAEDPVTIGRRLNEITQKLRAVTPPPDA